MRKERILDAFKKTSRDFREVCNELTGYRIDGLDNGQYRLTPRYAEQDGDHLLFRRAESGELLLLETRFSGQLDEQIDLHLNRQHSIPVFLAAVITDLFSRSTFDTAEYQSNDEDEDDSEVEDIEHVGGEEEQQEVEEEEDYSGGEEDEGVTDDEDDAEGAGAGDDDDPICID